LTGCIHNNITEAVHSDQEPDLLWTNQDRYPQDLDEQTGVYFYTPAIRPQSVL